MKKVILIFSIFITFNAKLQTKHIDYSKEVDTFRISGNIVNKLVIKDINIESTKTYVSSVLMYHGGAANTLYFTYFKNNILFDNNYLFNIT
jgi:hypothetical protein